MRLEKNFLESFSKNEPVKRQPNERQNGNIKLRDWGNALKTPHR